MYPSHGCRKRVNYAVQQQCKKKENLKQTLYSKPGLANQSIAIDRSNAVISPVDRGKVKLQIPELNYMTKIKAGNLNKKMVVLVQNRWCNVIYIVYIIHECTTRVKLRQYKKK